MDAMGPGAGPARDDRRPDDTLAAARVDALAGEMIASYQAGLTAKEIAAIYLVDLAAVEDVLASSGAQPPAPRSRWLRALTRRRGKHAS